MLDPKIISRLAEIVEKSNLTEFEYEDEGCRISMSKHHPHPAAPLPPFGPAPVPAPLPQAAPAQIAAPAAAPAAPVEEDYSKNDFYQWAIEVNDIEQPIGSISVVSLDEDVQSAEIGYCIGKSWWHQGYTTEAVEAVIRFLMAEVGAGRVWAQHDVANPNSGEVMKKAGMDYEGTLRQSAKNNQGIVDSAVYAKISHVALDEEPEEEEQTSGASVTKVMAEDGTMKNVISDDTMEYVGILAKLELSPEEAESAKKDMEDMLDYIDLLNELDTTGIEPMSHVFPIENVFREDVVTNGDGSEATLKNAPEQKDGGFKVPKTIGE